MNKTVEKTLKILDLIAKNPDGISLSTISKSLKIPKSTAHDILQTLYQEDAVYYKNTILKTYVIGSKLFAIGQTYTKNSSFIQAAQGALNEFAEKYGVTVFGTKRIGDKVTFVYKYESKKNKIITKDVGTQLPLVDSAMGKAFIAFEEQSKKFRSEAFLKDQLGVRGAKQYLLEVEEAVKAGIVIDNGTFESYIRWFAAPVYNFENRMSGCIACAMLITEETEDLVSKMTKDLLDVAKRTSSALGYQKLLDE